MDMETYMSFEQFAVSAKPAVISELSLLDKAEQEVSGMLQSSPLKNRLEQERISQQYVISKIYELIQSFVS